MTGRQQIARLLPLALLVILVAAGLRGAVAAPRWTGPLHADGLVIGIALEVVFGVLLTILLLRERAARRTTAASEPDGIQPDRALRLLLSWVLSLCMVGVALLLLFSLRLHFFAGPRSPRRLPTQPPPSLRLVKPSAGGSTSTHLSLTPILYGLLIAVIVAVIVFTIWWSTRLHASAAPRVIEDETAQDLREAVVQGRAALDSIDDARAAIIACYMAMERRLADRGTARGSTETPDELLARAVSSGVVHGAAAGRLTALFYEARFSSHPLGSGQREAASAALDELAGGLAATTGGDPS